MKKFLTVLVSIVFAVCLCLPLAACGDNGQTQGESKRIIGIDSDKTYLKAKYYLASGRDLNARTINFEILSYDKIEKNELRGVEFETTSIESTALFAASYDIKGSEFPDNNIYSYTVSVVTSIQWVGYELTVNSIILNIAGYEYKLSADIAFVPYSFRPVFIKPNTFGFNSINAGRSEPYGLVISTYYDTTLKSLKFQTEGFEILSYEVEYYTTATSGAAEKISESLPLNLEAEKNYQIFVEATAPSDCLYYGYSFEAVVDINGIEIVYNNTVDNIDSINFKGSALNALTA